ncbi:MAG: Fur family transcriptional regulator [Robiginitomaculum sp.]
MDNIKNILMEAGLRPTRQRIALAAYLFDGVDKHVTAEELHRVMGEGISLATVYNSIAAFTNAGLLHTLALDGGRIYYDTNITEHHHIYDITSGTLSDVPAEHISITGLPRLPKGKTLDSVDVIIRVK